MKKYLFLFQIIKVFITFTIDALFSLLVMVAKLPSGRTIFFVFIIILLLSGKLWGQENSSATQDSIQTSDTLKKKAPMILEKIVEIMEEKKSKSSVQDLLIDGLVIDETRTKMGRDFYEVFFTNWELPKGAQNFSLVVRELPGRATSSFISVEINDQEVLQLPLQPRYDIIEEMAKYAVERSYQYIANYEQIQKDLSSGDLRGSGIY